MKIKLPLLEDDVLEVELPSKEVLSLKLKTISAEQASKNGQSVRELEKGRVSGSLSYLDYNFRILDLAIVDFAKHKRSIAKLPDEYLSAIIQKLGDLRVERIERVKKNISDSLS